MSKNNQVNIDFNAVAAAVNAKLKEAADAIIEAQKIVKAAGIDYVAPDYQDYRNDKLSYEEREEFDNMLDISVLENAMGDAGWRTSSLSC